MGSISRAAGSAAIDLSSCIVPFHKTGQGDVTAGRLHCLRVTEKCNSSQPTAGSTDRLENLMVAQHYVIPPPLTKPNASYPDHESHRRTICG